jgi:prolyl oligopeptidase
MNLLLLAFLVLGLFLGCTSVIISDDSYLWLEEIEGEQAMSWVNAENSKTLKTLENEKKYKRYFDDAIKVMTSKERIPYGSIRNDYVYNFWQDNKNVRGIWRRTKLADYKKSRPNWEVILDIDKLAKMENENWVYKGVDCLAPQFNRCLLSLSRGGGDASEVREFDIGTKQFVEGGFFVPEAKSHFSWYDMDTLLIGTNWGEGSMTNSGYPQEQRIWKRGTPLSSAKLLFKGNKSDVSVGAFRDFKTDSQWTFLSRSISFYETEYYFVTPDWELIRIPIPADSGLEGVFKGEILVQLKSPWKFKTAKGENIVYSTGSLLSFSAEKFLRSKTIEEIRTIFVPSSKSSLMYVATTKNFVFFSVLENVKGRVFKAQFNGGKWQDSLVKLPDNGSAGIVSANSFSDDVLLTFQSFTIPDQLLLSRGGSIYPQVIKSLPQQFNSSHIEVKQAAA